MACRSNSVCQKRSVLPGHLTNQGTGNLGQIILTALPSITTTVQGGIVRDARKADRRLAWERLARSLLHCVCFSHSSNSSGPNHSRGSISRTTR